ncbi:MAG: hypothetical protein RIR00_2648 [Pseudomonadota bacterium]
MKRRNFLSAAVLGSLFTIDSALAKNKKPAPSANKKAGALADKKGAKPGKVRKPTTHTATTPITENPPVGSSSTHLPPVKAPEAPTQWRSYEIQTTITLPKTPGRSRLWLPLPLSQDTLYQRTLSHSWRDNADVASLRRLPEGDLDVFYGEWAEGVEPSLQLTTIVSTADRHFDVTRRTMPPDRDDILRKNLRASNLIPNDGDAHKLSEQIIGRIKDPIAQVRAIYEWVIDNSIYDLTLPGCGSGDIRKQIEERRYGGRSADINGLFVALCRAAGIPARCVYGLRLDNSRIFSSLGLRQGEATRGQHCRAEFYTPGYGWVPVDPSDVRRAMALEILGDRDPRTLSLKRLLFGVWEMNWLAYNFGNDIPLPESREVEPFFVLPRAELNGKSIAGLEPESFKYSISSRRLDG